MIYEPREKTRRALEKDVAWTTVDVLRGVIERGTGTAAQIDRPAAGKTGTTQNAADAWFAGFTPNLTTVTWMGYRDSNEAMPGSPTGGGFPAELWADYMREALEKLPEKDFPEPSGEYEIIGEPSPEPSSPPVTEDPATQEPVAPDPSVPAVEQPNSIDQFQRELEQQQRELEKALEEAEKEAERRRQQLEDELSASEEPQEETLPLDGGAEPPPE
jgi:penicillin-binding protein 1A